LLWFLRYLLQHSEWLKEELDNLGEDDYIMLDCPGQIELYSHLPIIHNLVKAMSSWGFTIVSAYLLDALFVLEPSKFISGCMLSLSCMIQLELPHINIITKMDLADRDEIESILGSEGAWMVSLLTKYFASSVSQLYCLYGEDKYYE